MSSLLAGLKRMQSLTSVFCQMTQRGLAPRIFDALFARIAEEETRLVRVYFLA